MLPKTPESTPISSKNKAEFSSEYIVSVEGSLGLLALGAKGLRAWRKIRNEHIKSTKDSTSITQ